MPKQVNGIWIPDAEQHLVRFLEKGPMFAGRGTYQLHKFMGCMPHIKNFRAAIDIGAHCGLWTRVMVQCFGQVVAFEPVPEHRECWNMNLVHTLNGQATLFPFALGEAEGTLELSAGVASTGDTHVRYKGEPAGLKVEVKTLDQYQHLFEMGLDFIKIDTEGWEYFILMGGETLIRRHRPMILVEQKSGKGSIYGIKDKAAVDLLEAWGAEKVYEMSGDFGMKFKR